MYLNGFTIVFEGAKVRKTGKFCYSVKDLSATYRDGMLVIDNQNKSL